MREPSVELRQFLEPYGPAISRLYFAARGAVLAAAPRANELVYDAYNAVTTAYSFTDRLKEAFCHVAAYRSYVNLGFNDGADLPDPARLLAGTGSRIRHLRISNVEDLRRPGVRSLLRAAVEQGKRTSLATPAEPRTIVKATCAKKRRPASLAKAKKRSGK